MAECDFGSINDCEELIVDLRRLADGMDVIAKDMLNAEADIVVEAQKKAAASMGVVDTGLMAASIKKGNVQTNKNGKIIYVSPSGTRNRKGITTRNAEIAFINEYGKAGQAPRPFIRQANETCADKAVEAAYKVYDNALDRTGL